MWSHWGPHLVSVKFQWGSGEALLSLSCVPKVGFHFFVIMGPFSWNESHCYLEHTGNQGPGVSICVSVFVWMCVYVYVCVHAGVRQCFDTCAQGGLAVIRSCFFLKHYLSLITCWQILQVVRDLAISMIAKKKKKANNSVMSTPVSVPVVSPVLFII